jgi:hypothetical protein
LNTITAHHAEYEIASDRNPWQREAIAWPEGR